MRQATLKQLSLLKTKKSVVVKISFLLLCFIMCLSSFTTKEESSFSEKFNNYVFSNVSNVISYLDSIDYLVQTKRHNRMQEQYYYEQARKHFKKIEFYTEYQFPFYSKYFINGALVNKAEFEYGFKTFVPHGFQVIEDLLYSDIKDTTIQSHYELSLLKQSFQYVKTKSLGRETENDKLIDMMRFEIIRIMSLYLNGYDCTINKQNLKEIEYILTGFESVIQFNSVENSNKDSFNELIRVTKNYLSKNNDYDRFNRLQFIVHYLKPLYEYLYHFYSEEALQTSNYYAINIREEKFYGDNWLNKSYFSVVLKDSSKVNDQIILGKLLFFDPILSGNNQRACASCHDPNKGFGSNTDFNVTFQAKDKLKRNTPSLINTLFQKNFFYDGRSLQLEDQVSDVLTNHKEMFAEPEDLVYKLKQSPDYRKYFHLAFKNTEDTAITYYAILKSISEFERSLISLNSRFDQYLKGNEKQLSKEEIAGYTTFAGKALCGSCHFFPLFNGLVPPFYSDNEFEVIGVPKNKLNKELDTDSGRYHVSNNNIHLSSFKTLGIRQLDQTAPYMHNGIYNTIEEVIEFYRKGGGAGLGISVPNQTLPFDSLELSKKEINNLKKFLLSLSDKSFHVPVPTSLPIVNIKGLEHRKIGGKY